MKKPLQQKENYVRQYEEEKKKKLWFLTGSTTLNSIDVWCIVEMYNWLTVEDFFEKGNYHAKHASMIIGLTKKSEHVN